MLIYHEDACMVNEHGNNEKHDDESKCILELSRENTFEI